MSEDTATALPRAPALPAIRVPAGWTLAGLVAGLVIGGLIAGSTGAAPVVAIAQPVGALWLHALQMTIVPLVAGLMFTGVIDAVSAAEGGAMARRTLALFAVLLTAATVMSALLTPALLTIAPIPREAAAVLARQAPAATGTVPGIGQLLGAIIPENVVEAAARGAMLPVLVFVTLFALAATRLSAAHRDLLAGLFAALAGAMMVVIGWVLTIAPLGVFALGLTLAAGSGFSAMAALGHYIALVASIGCVVLLGAYGLAAGAARLSPLAFARAVLPVQALALSTQSSLACLPAMLAACRRLGVRDGSAEFVLPLAVTLFRATSPAMNLAVALYAAKLTGTPLSPAVIAIGAGAALLTTMGSVSLPGTISFIASVAPIAFAMGVPLAPLGLLVAVEMLPDLIRTVGNVTMDVAVVTVVDRGRTQET
jgi:Na+/H+-dicarboxylate symporter